MLGIRTHTSKYSHIYAYTYTHNHIHMHTHTRIFMSLCLRCCNILNLLFSSSGNSKSAILPNLLTSFTTTPVSYIASGYRDISSNNILSLATLPARLCSTFISVISAYFTMQIEVCSFRGSTSTIAFKVLLLRCGRGSVYMDLVEARNADCTSASAGGLARHCSSPRESEGMSKNSGT